MSRAIIRRMERDITKRTIRALLEAGFWLAVHDGEELSRSTRDPDFVLDLLMDLDDAYLYAVSPTEGNIGWVRFVYGNDGWDSINDCTVNLETVLKPVDEYVDSLS